MIELTLDDFEKIEDQKEAKKILKKLANQNSARELSEHWGIPIPHVRKMRTKFGIKKRAGNGKQKTKKQTKAALSSGNLDYNISIEGTLTGERLYEKLDALKSLLSAMPNEMFEVKIHSAQDSSMK